MNGRASSSEVGTCIPPRMKKQIRGDARDTGTQEKLFGVIILPETQRHSRVLHPLVVLRTAKIIGSEAACFQAADSQEATDARALPKCLQPNHLSPTQ